MSSNKNDRPDSQGVAEFAAALDLIHNQKWKEAADRFEKLVESTDDPTLIDRCRQYLTICAQHTDQAPEAEDPYLQAVFEKNEGNLEKALGLCQENSDNDERYAYLEASIQALIGNEEDALKALEESIRLEAKNRVHAYHDPDFRMLREHEQFQELVHVS